MPHGAYILSRHAGGAPRAIDEPTPCQVAKHSHILVEPASPLIAPYYGSGSGNTCTDVEKSLDVRNSGPRALSR